MQLMKNKWIKYYILFFSIIWIYNYTFNYYFQIPHGRILPYTLFFIIDNIILVVYFYANLFLSRFVLRKIVYLIPFQLVLMIVGCYLLSFAPWCFKTMEDLNPDFMQVYFMKMFDVAFISFGSISFLFLQKWDESTQQKLQLLESLTEAELTFLRSQMSPHFLLNTLNVIYSLALNKSPEIKLAMSELKNIYSYVRKNQEMVSLNDEIQYLENFIKIQKRRFGENLDLQLHILVDKDYLIEPLLLSTFIENAFKHGVSMRAPSYIHIDLSVTESRLEYLVINSDHSLKYKDSTSGIGFHNLSRRLQLLYPGRFSLEHFSSKGKYISKLILRNL
jgi:two-component system, LytTR family, sensor kinase